MTTPIIPSEEQLRILELGLTSIKIRAGAGTGKTTTVAMLIANLIATEDLEPEQVLGITFTNKAASELADRVRSIAGTEEPGRQVEVHTYHGFAAQVLAEFGPMVGVDTRLKVITPTFTRQLLSETYHRRDYAHLDITSTHSLDRIRRLGDRLGDHLLTPQDILGIPAVGEVEMARHEMAATLAVYEAEKRRLGIVDYADLVTLSTLIVRDHPELAGLIRDRYRVVVLDEYQDTNPAQRALIAAIFTNGFPVVAVGDEDQTIYEWRGASTENFEQFQTHFPRPDGHLAHLETLTLNRRSTKKVLDVANAVRQRAGEMPEELVSALAEDEESEVVTFWAPDSLAEAEWIARRFEQLHSSGERWKDMAVLFRKNKDFAMVIDVFSRHDIPLEVANIGGLLAVPEVAEVRSWLTILERPEDGAALTDILFGSRYRLGLADLAPLVQHASGGDPEDDEEPLTLIESMESMAQLPDLRAEARASLSHFSGVYRQLLLESQGLTLVDVCRQILDLTGAWRDVESLPANQRLTARLNLYRLLDLAEDWSPLRGRPSIQAFLEYLEATEEEPADELDSARLSGEDAVTFVTIHRAKGLEWDTVAIPGVAVGNLPSRTAEYPDPWRFPHHLPPGLRIDHTLDDLPDDEGAAKDYLKSRHDRQEWRVAYVAVTRAKRRLFISGAYWYAQRETLKTPKQPSELWSLVDGLEVSSCDGVAEPGDRPEVLRLEELAVAPDPHFPDGWATALRAALSDPGTIDTLADSLGLAEETSTLVTEIEARLFALDGVEPSGGIPTPDVVSVTGLVTYAQCPKRYFWTVVDPLPRRHSPAATRGTQVHRRIELHQRGQVPLEAEDQDPFEPGEGAEPGAYDAYMTSRFAAQRASLLEAPFEIDVGVRIRGRIDAIYSDDARWEVVDFKSGRREEDPSRLVQLQAYAMAAHDFDFGLIPPTDLRVTFAYLGGGLDEVSYEADTGWLSGARATVSTLATGITEDRFDERPGPWCERCDFLRFCAPGRSHLA
jgi:DNA helicase-2/ATP-dependent DNA helicase PcrA